MPKLGRNEPCPCGSGKKYKKCCLLRRRSVGHYTKAERDAALMYVVSLLQADAALEDDLLRDFYEGCPPLGDDTALKDMSDISFEVWACFDVVLKGGQTLGELASRSPRLTPGERGFLELMCRSTARLYEVVDVVRGASLTLRDVITEEVHVVQERRGSEQLPRWSLVATRVIPCGTAEPPLVCDGGILPIPSAKREWLIDVVHDEIDVIREDCPELDEAALQFEAFKTMAPTFHRAWIAPALPKSLVNYDGDPLLFSESFFDLLDGDAAAARLDASDLLERSGDAWVWHGTGADRPEPVVLGLVERRGNRLVLQTNSQSRDARGRELLAELLGSTARYRMTSTADVLEDIKEKMMNQAPEERAGPEPDELDPATRSALNDAVEAHLHRHYEAWLDDSVPALAGETPRAAAASPKLRPRLVELVKELEISYAHALREGEPAFDPSWIWDELGLADELASPRDRRLPPPLGHERIAARVPDLGAVAEQVASRVRAATEGALSRTIERRELMDDLGVRRFLCEQGSAPADATSPGVDALADHLELRANFELHLRKVFWVDDALSWTLGATRLDVSGAALRVPFGAFALVFTDRYALGLAERAISRDPTCPIRGVLLEVVTIYVSELDGGRGLRLAITCDPLGDVWPHLIVRDLEVRADADLSAVLDGGFPGVDDDLAPLYACTPLRNLVHLALNAILYATSADARAEPRAPAEPAPRRRGERLVHTSESVHFLPGAIDITTLRAIQRARRNASDFEVILRSMVRGHWRRAAPGWSDQRLRWIKPYWRGPSAAAVIERQYRLRP